MRPRLAAPFLALLSACADRGAAAPSSCVRSEDRFAIAPTGLEALDVLFVIDDSPAMRTRASSLRASLGAVADALLHPSAEEAYDSLHLAVVSADLGTPGTAVAGCTAEGDDGRLDVGACATSRGFPSFLSFGDDADTPSRGPADFVCTTDLGTAGCTVQQPLEAATRALAASPGFVRPDALLAIVVIAASDDASVRDCRHAEAGTVCDDATSVFDLANPRWTGPTLAARLTGFVDGSAQDPTWPLDRYIDPAHPARGFTGIKLNYPQNVMFTVATTVPTELPTTPFGTTDWNALLASSDPLSRRLLRVAQRFAETYDGGSVVALDGDLVALTRPMHQRLAQRLVSRCVSRVLPTHAMAPCCDPTGAPIGCATAPTCGDPAAVTVPCTVTEHLGPTTDPATWCTAAHGRHRGPDVEGRATCTIDPLAAAPGAAPPTGTHGFYYDTAVDPTNPSCASRISFTRGDKPRFGSATTLDCMLAPTDGC